MREQEFNIDYAILKRDYIIINVATGVAVLAMGIFVLLQQLDIIYSAPCMMHDLLHVYCPGCGGTRAVFALIHGRIWESLCYNPAVIMGGLLIIYYELGVFLTIVKKNGKKYYVASGWPAYVYLIFIFAYGIVRDVMLLGFHVDMLHDFIK